MMAPLDLSIVFDFTNSLEGVLKYISSATNMEATV
jgi:hypothetical protein